MFRQLVALNSTRHAGLRVREQSGFGFAARVHMAALMQPEMVRAAATYPIVFVEDREGDGFRPMALFGLREGENLFVAPDGRWLVSYVPAVIRSYPFALSRADPGGRPAVCIDAASELVSLTEGAALFDANGAATPALEAAKGYLASLRQMQAVTDAFCLALAERNLFTPFSMRVQRGAQTLEVDGCYVINEERLDGLPDDRLAGLRERGWLAALYAQVVSLQQIERLEAGPAAARP